MTPHEYLAKHRGELVTAATDAMKRTVHRESKTVEKAQLSHLVGVCNAATCAEEIELYLRYQAARDVWPMDAVADLIERFAGVVPAATEQHLRVAAWRLYAVYLARAFTYEKAVKDAGPPIGNRTPAPKQPGSDPRGQTDSRGGRR